ncbi:CyP450 monooxygenase [Trametes sanguinea]|nr:CyP450 monooxygenase [Trametes sanguinea]
MFDLPVSRPWLGFRTMCATFGDLIYLQAPGNRFLVVSDPAAALELLEKKSANTSSRAGNIVAKLTGMEYIFGILPYGKLWRRQRRDFWYHFHPTVVPKYHPIQIAQTRVFLQRLISSPSKLKAHIRFNFAATMLQLVYNIRVQNERNDYAVLLEDGIRVFGQAAPGQFLVETLPFLRHVPAWFPGAGFQHTFAAARAANRELQRRPFAEAKRTFVRDCLDAELQHSIAGSLLARSGYRPGAEIDPEEQRIMENICTITIFGGSDTTHSMMQGVFKALSLYPDVRKKAQVELDAVVGRHRLPNYADRDNLLYVNALMKEILRWHLPVPIGIPHMTMKDDSFRGYFVPADTILVVNVWDILHDPVEYPQPDEFRPERFIRDGQLNPDIRDPTQYMFGFGRRICPGRHFAEDALFLTIASVLHVFDIGLPLDDDGRPVRVEYQQSDGLLSYPEDCECTIKPRSAEALKLVLDN